MEEECRIVATVITNDPNQIEDLVNRIAVAIDHVKQLAHNRHYSKKKIINKFNIAEQCGNTVYLNYSLLQSQMPSKRPKKKYEKCEHQLRQPNAAHKRQITDTNVSAENKRKERTFCTCNCIFISAENIANSNVRCVNAQQKDTSEADAQKSIFKTRVQRFGRSPSQIKLTSVNFSCVSMMRTKLRTNSALGSSDSQIMPTLMTSGTLVSVLRMTAVCLPQFAYRTPRE